MPSSPPITYDPLGLLRYRPYLYFFNTIGEAGEEAGRERKELEAGRGEGSWKQEGRGKKGGGEKGEGVRCNEETDAMGEMDAMEETEEMKGSLILL